MFISAQPAQKAQHTYSKSHNLFPLYSFGQPPGPMKKLETSVYHGVISRGGSIAYGARIRRIAYGANCNRCETFVAHARHGVSHAKHGTFARETSHMTHIVTDAQHDVSHARQWLLHMRELTMFRMRNTQKTLACGTFAHGASHTK